ncbi:MAG TPA: hypothetical protein VGD43_05315 [Micromonospora sp.]
MRRDYADDRVGLALFLGVMLDDALADAARMAPGADAGALYQRILLDSLPPRLRRRTG